MSKKKELVELPKTKFFFPKENITIEATSNEEALNILNNNNK